MINWLSKGRKRWSTTPWNLTKKAEAIARAHGTHVFNIGDPAVLLYAHKDRVFKAQVRVVAASWVGPLDAGGELMGFAPDHIKYTVVSEHGGVMTVGAPSLRPGGALDRIVLALELDEISESSE